MSLVILGVPPLSVKQIPANDAGFHEKRDRPKLRKQPSVLFNSSFLPQPSRPASFRESFRS